MKDTNIMDIGKFLTKYLGIKLDYSKKKLTHTKLIEILHDYHMEDCILSRYDIIDEIDIYNGKVIRVKDQVGQIRNYINPYLYTNEVVHQIDSEIIETDIKSKECLLEELYKKQIHEIGKIEEHVDNINQINKDIELLKNLIEIYKEKELEQEQERETYNIKIREKTKRRQRNDKYKRR